MKRHLFRATVESLLIYGSVRWNLTKALAKRINGNYTRMVRAVLNRYWKDHPNNKYIYVNIPDIYKTSQIAFFWALLEFQIGTGIQMS